LGDVANPGELELSIFGLDLPARTAPIFLKAGFAGVQSAYAVSETLRVAVKTAEKHRCTPQIIAVAYADHSLAQTLAPESIRAAALDAGCAGILLDTFTKRSGNLLTWYPSAPLARWIKGGRKHGLLVAIAGGIGIGELPEVATLGPDVIGVRGAACEGGRTGRVTIARVRGLRSLVSPNSDFLQAVEMPMTPLASRKA
jgi:uncharacterized protein (UPF0264 family)